MAGEADVEISFEDAMGESAVPPTTKTVASSTSSSDEIDFNEAAGLSSKPATTSTAKPFDRRAFDEAFQQGLSLFTPDPEKDYQPDPSDSFVDRVGKTLMRGVGALARSPGETAIGAGKAVVSGATSMVESSAAGLKGIAAAGASIADNQQLLLMGQLGFKELLSGAGEAFSQGMETSQQATAKMREVAGKITNVNLAPENGQDKAMEDLLMLIPEGITAAGDTVFERTGSAIAGAGSQALLTLLTFKPSIASKTLKGLSGRKDVKAAVDGLAKTDPTAAETLAKHVEAESPRTATVIRERIEAVKTVSPEELGTAVAEAEIAAKAAKAEGKPFVKPRLRVKEITPEEAGVGLAKTTTEVAAAADKPLPVKSVDAARPKPEYLIDEDVGQHTVKSPVGEFLAQENRQYLQVKRADVAAESRGQGYAQEAMAMLFEEAQKRDLTLASDFSVSPEAQRVYDALRCKGFEIKENPSSVNPETGNRVSADPRLPVFEVTRAPISEAAVAEATQIFANGPTLDAVPGAQFAKGKLAAWYDEIIRTINPEALGPQAKMSAAVVANRIAESMNKDATNHGRARDRIRFWERTKPETVRDFVKRYEQGKPQSDRVLQLADDNIRQRNKEIYDSDQRLGIKYDPIDNYLYHVFQEGEKLAAHFQAKYGAKWGDPKFTKDRSFDLYEEAVKAGFKPKYTNPEEIMLVRQHASDIAQMKVEILRDLETYGLAKRKAKGDPDPPKGVESVYRRSPTGDGYWVDARADAILHNAFDTKSLWSMSGIRGDLFRAAMLLKNTIVPIKLALSLFHPLHVATIDNATGMVRASKELLSGKTNPVRWLGQMVDASLYGSKGIPLLGLWDNPSTGNRILRAYQGKIDPAKLTSADVDSLRYMAEGGMIPEMSVQYKTSAIESLRKAVNARSATAVWHLPFAVVQALQKPMFEIWIPSLKIASYLKDVGTAMKTDPSLVVDKGKRLLAFRKLAKSVDNRYGEMAYNTLFWNRTVKDLAVANTLSLGWNLGFIREYGGGAMDIGQSVTRSGKLSQKASTGMLDRPLFVAFYTTQALLYGGLLTWALTGEQPKDFNDYIYPRNGNTTPDGKPERVNTMFYPREFAAISKHIEHEGVVGGLGHLVANKASGVIGLTSQWATGVNSFDQEIRDPNSPWHEQLNQTLAATLLELEPISVKSTRDSPGTLKDAALSVSGFSKAPKYVTQSDTEAAITTLYRKYNAPKQTPYEKAILSDDNRKLKKLYDSGDIQGYSDLLDKVQEKYDLTAKEQTKLVQRTLKSGASGDSPYKSMFQRLTWQQQKRLLDKMTEEERAEYLPVANREHIRFQYEAPEDSK